ncbi:8098_t:CDS:2, partial [Cetraspora pellucida]
MGKFLLEAAIKPQEQETLQKQKQMVSKLLEALEEEQKNREQ